MPEICDSCLTAAYDEVGDGHEEQMVVCLDLGADIPDHLCDALEEEGQTAWETCACACHQEAKRARKAQKVAA